MEAIRQQFPADDFTLLAVVLLLPLVGALVNGIFGKRLGKEGVRMMALSAVGGSFLASVLTFLAITGANAGGPIAGGHGAKAKVLWNAWRWFSVDGQAGQPIPIDIAFSADGLSGTMMLIVTGVGFLIHLYSTGYMAKDPGYHRFFAYLNLFIFSMLVLILGDNLAVLFIGWEGVGLCSYLLIGFWFTDEAKAAAGKKAFIVNRIGDFGLLVAMAMLVHYAGALDWASLEGRAGSLVQSVRVWPLTDLSQSLLPGPVAGWLTPKQDIRMWVPTLVGVAIFLGCAGKSAQIPLYVWLPDAMAGPTPVSALIHAATMVTAGVYLVARTSFLFVLSPAAMAIVAGIGAFTALLAASIALVQNDLKKVLAYSTVSQLGFMFIGVGSGAFGAGFFHVLTHAFFKGCLFLCAGSVIHALHARVHDDVRSQDMRFMGGLGKYMPWTRATYLVSCLAIAGCPPFSGFWSKDLILWKAFSTQIKPPNPQMWSAPAWFGPAVYGIGIVAAVGTAFYMFRSYFLTFEGSFRGWTIVKGWRPPKGHGHHDEHHDEEALPDEEDGDLEGPAPKESPWSMTVPLVVLAFLATIAGALYMEPVHFEPLGHLLEPVFGKSLGQVGPRGVESLEHTFLGIGVGAFAVGAGLAYFVYQVRAGAPAKQLADKVPWLYQLLLDKWRVDELYDATVVGMVDAMGDTAAQVDKWVIDGILARVTAAVATISGTLLRSLQTGRVQVYAAAMVIGTTAIGWFVLTPHAMADVDDSLLKRGGRLALTAAPGHGYSYRWHVGGGEATAQFGAQTKLTLEIGKCETKTVHLAVQNIFGRVAETSFTHCREVSAGCCKAEGKADAVLAEKGTKPAPKGAAKPADSSIYGTHDAGVIDKILGVPPRPGSTTRPGAPAKGGRP